MPTPKLPSLVTRSLVAMVLAAGCSSSSSSTSTAAAVAGPVDMHCVMNDEPIKQQIGECVAEGADASTSALSSDDAGSDAGADDASADGGDNGGSDFGATLYNSEGDDDDCKYHVKWTSTSVKESSGATFDVNLVRLFDGKPATGADVQVEAFLTETHPTPSVDIKTTETAGGNYQIGPVTFDAPGKWTVRFHFYETCSDTPEDSPHGHAAFFVNVP
jgi:hypothetical protein